MAGMQNIAGVTVQILHTFGKDRDTVTVLIWFLAWFRAVFVSHTWQPCHKWMIHV